MPLDLSVPAQLSAALIPDIVLAVGAMVLLLYATWGPDSPARHRRTIWLGVGVVVVTAAAVVGMIARGVTAAPGVIAVDGFRWATDLIVLLAAAITLALSLDYDAREGITLAEGPVLVLLAASGMMLLAAARDLMIVFLGIELMSIAVYVLAGLDRRSSRGAEAALKYFLLGAFSTGFLLYGIALVYGATGSTALAAIAPHVRSAAMDTSPMLLVGIALLVVGFGFKVAAVPFHMWTPDVYEGAPTPITAFMAAGVKAAAFAVFLRVWLEAFSGAAAAWHLPLWWLAVVTMVVGNLVALAQQNIKRLLAYSSIAHAGYLLVAIVVGTDLGASAFIFYLIAYTLATMGAFGVVVALDQGGGRGERLADYRGLWTVEPWLAAAMAVFMLALLGFPIAGGMGFFAKWYVLRAALAGPAPQTRLAVVLVLTSVISAGYYLAVVISMFMRTRAGDASPARPVAGATRFVIGAAAVLLLVFGIFPGGVATLARRSVPAGTAAAAVAARPAVPVASAGIAPGR